MLSNLHKGLPDRMLITPKGKIVFIEFKTKGNKPTNIQLHIHSLFKNYKQEVYVIDEFSKMLDVQDELRNK